MSVFDPQPEPEYYDPNDTVIRDKAPESAPEAETEISLATSNSGVNSHLERKAKRLLDNVKLGMSLTTAADRERVSVKDIKDPTSQTGAAVRALVGEYFLPAEARKQMVRAGLNKLFVENVAKPDKDSQKIALDAAKQIGSDPEVGLNTEASGGVVINIGELDGVFKQLHATKIPQIDDGRGDIRPGAGGEVEAEFENLPE